MPILNRQSSALRNTFASASCIPAIIEKDYYVTEALRFLATTSRDKIIFEIGYEYRQRMEPN